MSAIRQTMNKFAIRSFKDLKRRCQETGGAQQLIEGLFPEGQIAFVVGDSGLGKSPLLYQAGMCLAAGIPFLNRACIRAHVLYMDYENSGSDSEYLQEQIRKHLKLSNIPEDFFHVWNLYDCAPNFGSPNHTADDLIQEWGNALGDVGPKVAIIDSLSSYDPGIEDNERAIRVYQKFRRIHRSVGVTIWGVHHIKKPSFKPGEEPPTIDSGDMRRWLLQARGGRALVNGSDVRIGIDLPGVTSQIRNIKRPDQEEVALVLGGFRRVRGPIGPLYLSRAFDPDDGEPVGYRILTAVDLLFNSEHEAAFRRAPGEFTFTEAKRIYQKSDSATTHWLGKCCARGLLFKRGRLYVKNPEAR